MSLTEEQKTAKNFQEYHKRILPYLNGSFPTPIVNKFSKGDLYSTEEKIIGQWIDGKPLYQKTFEVNVSPAYNSWVNIVTLPGVDRVISIPHILFINNSGNYLVATGSGIEFLFDNSILKAEYNTNVNNRPINIITLQYTKTTDSPISIGDGNDYSTDEQVVGTWIDGKPLYQKTISGTLLSETNIDLTSLNIDYIQIVSGDLERNAGSAGIIHYPISAMDGSVAFVTKYYENTKILRITYNLPGESGGNYNLTIQYTKTTD